MARKGRGGSGRDSARSRSGSAVPRRAADPRNDSSRTRAGIQRNDSSRPGQRRRLAQSRFARFRFRRHRRRSRGPRPTHLPAKPRAAQRPTLRGALCPGADAALGRQGTSQYSALADQHRGRPTGPGQRTGASRVAGQRSFHSARGPRLRRHLAQSPNSVNEQMPTTSPQQHWNILLTSHTSLTTRRFFRLFSFSLLLYFLTSFPLPSEHTRRWRQSTYDEFLKGTAHGVAVRSDGRLELAPKFTLLADADASYLWSVRLDAKGTLYAAGGSPGRVFRFDSNAKPTVVFDSTDLSAQAIAFDSKGTLYVGTSPDGKVYKVSASGEKSVFFDPKTKYIWDLGFSPDGTLYVATGDKGQVFAVAPDGKGELFYSSEEAHIRVLAFDANKNLIAGTEPSGRILRISRTTSQNSKNSKASASATAEGFVLYETSKREVTSLAVASDGRIYASAIGEKARAGAPAP